MNVDAISRVLSAACKSRATPKCDIASARFGVKPISISWSTSSFFPKRSNVEVPGVKFSGKTKIPELSVPIPNSTSEQIIPKDSSPRIFAFLILNSPSGEGKTVPTVATGTF